MNEKSVISCSIKDLIETWAIGRVYTCKDVIISPNLNNKRMYAYRTNQGFLQREVDQRILIEIFYEVAVEGRLHFKCLNFTKML